MPVGSPEGLLGLLLGLLEGIVMEGVLVGMVAVGEADGEAVEEADGEAEGMPLVVAKVVMLVQSMGLKFSVGTPLARIWFIPP